MELPVNLIISTLNIKRKKEQCLGEVFMFHAYLAFITLSLTFWPTRTIIKFNSQVLTTTHLKITNMEELEKCERE